jgi:hypothetical protein
MAPRKAASEGIDTRGILIGGAAILSAITLSLLAAWGLLALFGGKLRSPTLAPPAITGPVLESHPLEDFSTYERRERERLSTYGWVDRASGEVHMPIEVAMDRLSRQRSGAPASPGARPGRQ